MTDNDLLEITSDEEASNTIREVEGHINDADESIQDKEYSEAVEMLDNAIEALTAIRKYLQIKADE